VFSNSVGGDIVSVGSYGASFGDKNVGINKAFNITGGALIGADAGNYSLPSLLNIRSDAKITPALLTVTAHAKIREYGDNNPKLTYTLSGFVGGETATEIETLPNVTTALGKMANVGDYNNALVPGGGVDTQGNYSFNYSAANMTIMPATLVVTADNQTKIYGDLNPDLTVSYAGFKNNETVSVLETSPNINTLIDNMTSVGTYNLLPSDGMDAQGNYNLIYNGGNMTIIPAELTITADNQTKPYRADNPELTGVITGFKNNDSLDDLIILSDYQTDVVKDSVSGDYVIHTFKASNDNYNIIHIDGIFTVNERTFIPNTVEYISYNGAERIKNHSVPQVILQADPQIIVAPNMQIDYIDKDILERLKANNQVVKRSQSGPEIGRHNYTE
jgi:hypothetical protein